jgi:hypothetical protein
MPFAIGFCRFARGLPDPPKDKNQRKADCCLFSPSCRSETNFFHDELQGWMGMARQIIPRLSGPDRFGGAVRYHFWRVQFAHRTEMHVSSLSTVLQISDTATDPHNFSISSMTVIQVLNASRSVMASSGRDIPLDRRFYRQTNSSPRYTMVFIQYDNGVAFVNQ